MSDIPRRACIDLFTPAEKAIREAIIAVESAGCDARLTWAVMSLSDAQAWVADFVDGVPCEDHYPRPPIPPQVLADLQARVVGRMIGASPEVCLDVGRAYIASQPVLESSTFADSGTGQAVTVQPPPGAVVTFRVPPAPQTTPALAVPAGQQCSNCGERGDLWPQEKRGHRYVVCARCGRVQPMKHPAPSRPPTTPAPARDGCDLYLPTPPLGQAGPLRDCRGDGHYLCRGCARYETTPAPEGTPPCGGSRCWRAPEGTWIHSSKSYDTCSASRLSTEGAAAPGKEEP